MIEFFKELFTLLNNYSSGVASMVAILAVFLAFLKFTEYIRDKRFNAYHELISRLVEGKVNSNKEIKLDCQIATVYELRNFPKYFNVSKRILKGLQKTWKTSDERLLSEIELTISYMERKWYDICD